MLFEKQKIILFHPGKTGGTSLEYSLRDLYQKKLTLQAMKQNLDFMFGFDEKYKIFLQHADLFFYQNILRKNLNNYTTITTVRNPYDRLVSCYFYNGLAKKFNFEEFILNKLENLIKINDKKGYSVNHFSPQIKFLKLNDYSVSHIVKLEKFKEDLEKININTEYTYSKTISRKKDYKYYYNENTKDLVYQLYKEDFKYLNYEY